MKEQRALICTFALKALEALQRMPSFLSCLVVCRSSSKLPPPHSSHSPPLFDESRESKNSKLSLGCGATWTSAFLSFICSASISGLSRGATLFLVKSNRYRRVVEEFSTTSFFFFTLCGN